MTLPPHITGRAAILLATSALAGCGALSSTTSATTETTEYVVNGDMTAASYDVTTDTLTISSIPFDNGVFAATYTRNAALDTNGFRAYVNTNGLRNYVALWGISNNGTGKVGAGVVATGDYLNHGFSGSTYGRDASSTLPTTGLATFTGRYAGLLTYDGSGGVDRTTGTVNIDVDFTDGVVEGTVTNRSNVTQATAQDNVILATTYITDGKFSSGVATSYNAGVEVEKGTYEGIIGGDTGLEVAGVIILTSTTGALPTKETGVFVTDTATVLPSP